MIQMIDSIYLKIRHQGVLLYFNAIYPQILKHRAKGIGKKKSIEVVFFAINVAMWRYQGVYDLLAKDERFNCHIVLTSARQFSPEQRVSNLATMRNYFDSLGVSYIDYDEEQDKGFDVKGKINPDILFYPQPYVDQYVDYHRYDKFYDKLLCYIPYSINVLKEDNWIYDLNFHNLVWKIYLPLIWEKRVAEKVARNHGRNALVSGYLNLDRYLDGSEMANVWKIKDKEHKRLIWAPHFSVDTEHALLKGRANFLWMSQIMLDIAVEYKDRLQIAFKPHPWLKSKLYELPDWGKEKTDQYFEKWAMMENTQLETEDFVDLFKSSDAMIHDSGSFTAEYLFVNKPVAFTTKDIQSLMDEHSTFGRECLKQHYVLGNEEEVRSFIDSVVLDGKDPKANQRKVFFDSVLRPNVKGTTSDFIVADLKKSLGIKR